VKIYGLNKTTLLDYPGHVAATVFTGGCNFRCPYCHNSSLVTGVGAAEVMPEEELFCFLDRRRGVLEGVCITGGEPALHKDLGNFIRKIKEMGYLVKLDTNGYQPGVLWNLLEEGILDYIAMDVKGSRKRYGEASGIANMNLSRVEESIGMIRDSKIEYEFRTTVVKGLHTEEDMEDIGKWIAGCRAYYLQSYRENENVLMPGYDSFDREEMEKFVEIARKYIDNAAIRGVE